MAAQRRRLPPGRLVAIAMLATVIAVTLTVSSCSDDERTREHCGSGAACASPRRCVRSGDAEVCGTRNGNGVDMSAAGMSPGSQISLTNGSNDLVLQTIGATGGFDGKVFFISAVPTRFEIAVSGTAADGGALNGTLVLE
jgi:hypothetical protein